MPDIIKEIADKVAAAIRDNKHLPPKERFQKSYDEIKQLYPGVDHEVVKPLVASNLGKRRKRRKPKPTHSPHQMEFFLGVPYTRARRDAEAHEGDLTRGLPEHDL